MKYVVYGAGAVGGVIGGHLHLAGLPVTLVARGAHLAAIRSGGLVLDAGDGRHRIDAPATDTAADVAWTDDTVVVLAVKSHQAAVALADLRAHAPAGTAIVCATNGIATEAAALRLFARTYAVCVMLPSSHLEPGVVVAGVPPDAGDPRHRPDPRRHRRDHRRRGRRPRRRGHRLGASATTSWRGSAASS